MGHLNPSSLTALPATMEDWDWLIDIFSKRNESRNQHEHSLPREVAGSESESDSGYEYEYYESETEVLPPPSNHTSSHKSNIC
jgi:hypothetical protein